MEVVLTIATVLGGVAAAWYFWDKWADRKAHPQPAAANGQAAPTVPRARSGTAVVLHGELRAFGILMGEDAGAARRAVARARQVLVATVNEHGGRLGVAPADALLAVFDAAVQALSCAVAARSALARANATLPPAEHVHYRFGLDLGESGRTDQSPPKATLERAASIVRRAPTDGIRLTEAVQAQLPDDAGYLLSAVEPGLFALADGEVPAGSRPVPAQLESLALPLPDRPSIVLLPFTCTGQDPETAALADGLRIDIQNALVKMPGVFLIAAGSANALRGIDATDAARRLGVRNALEGTVQRQGERVRVNVQLTDTAAGTVTWSERYDRALDHTFELQDEIAARVVTALDVKLASGEQARIWHKCLTVPKSRDLFYRGMQAFFQMNKESMAAARTCFDRVVELAPDSSHGPSWIAMCLWFEVARGWSSDPEQARAAAGEWAERAVGMADADGQAHTVLGNVRLLQRRYDEALATARQAAAIRPNCTNANGFLANVLLHCGEPDAALTHIRRAIRYSPVYPPWFVEILAASYREGGQVDFAVSAAQEGLRIAPQAVNCRLILASALVRGGWVADARRIAGEVAGVAPDFSLARHAAQEPYRDQAVLDRVVGELRSAGLPD
jgi:TolB-like protein/Tfp pilus assembly protein PilF